MIFGIVIIIIWIYSIYVCHTKQLRFFKFILGTFGLFLLFNILFFDMLKFGLETIFDTFLYEFTCIMNYLHVPEVDLIRNTFQGIYINRYHYEVIEVIIVVCLAIFFPVYNIKRKIINIILSVIYIIMINLFLMFLELLFIYFLDYRNESIIIIVISRSIYFVFITMLYYNFFTKPHVFSQKIGQLH